MILAELVNEVRSSGKLPPIEDIRAGLFYTAVKLEDGRAGVAATPRVLVTPRPRDAKDLRDLGTEKVLELALSPDPLLSAIGVATLNAFLPGSAEAIEGDLLDHLGVREDDRVGMVGYFAPFAEKLKGHVRELYIFERSERVEHVYPDWAEPLLLPGCDVVIISGTTFVNKTIDFVLKHTTNARKVAIAGPTTPLSVSLLGKIDILSGIRVTDPDRLLVLVSQGGGTKAIMSVARKVNLLKER